MDVSGPGDAANRLLEGHEGRDGAATLRAALADLYEFWVTKAAMAAGIDTRSGLALAAVGGLGRREFVPFSDLDLVLLHTHDPDIGEIADALWYPLWDAGVGLDHSVRTVPEALDVAAHDLRTATGLLEARHIAGDAELTSRLVAAAREQWRRTARRRAPELVASTRERWRRSGEIAQSAEPDLKYAHGGLRDLGLLDALATAQLTERPGGQLRSSRALLLDVRTELRRQLRRDRDVLGAADADAVAAQLGLGDRFRLARTLSAAGRTVAYAVDVALRVATPSAEGRPGQRPRRTPLDDGVVLHGAEVALARGVAPARDPGLLLRVACASARSGTPIAQGTLRTLAASAPQPRAPWPEQVRHAMTSLLGAGEGLVDVVEALDRTGLWARLFPEWGAVRDLPPREPVHAWTVDRHLVRTCVAASRLATTVSRPDLLLLGALLHDIGKGRDADHCELGSRIAARVAGRIGLSMQDARLVAAMVRHHLLLAHTATRRDIGERRTVERVARTLDGNVVLLELLHALTQADSLATGPGAWTGWKAGLVDELVSRCRELLQGRAFAAPDPVGRAHGALAETAARTGRGQLHASTAETPATVVFAVPAGAELLVPAAGVLALHSLEVHSATLRDHRGGRVGVFTASPMFGSFPDVALMREQFARAVVSEHRLDRGLAEKERAYGAGPAAQAEPQVLWFEGETAGTGTIVLELRAGDRIGLLYRVADALRGCDAEVRWAKVATLGGVVVDSFAVSPRLRRIDTLWRWRVERAVLAAAS